MPFQPITSDLTRSLEEHEVDYVPRRCVRVPIGGRFAARGMAGTTLHVRGGVIGEHAYDADRPEIAVGAGRYAEAAGFAEQAHRLLGDISEA